MRISLNSRRVSLCSSIFFKVPGRDQWLCSRAHRASRIDERKQDLANVVHIGLAIVQECAALSKGGVLIAVIEGIAFQTTLLDSLFTGPHR